MVSPLPAIVNPSALPAVVNPSALPAVSDPSALPAVSTLGDSVVTWLWTLLLFLFPGLVAAGLCAPFLAVERLRSLFRTLPPTGRVLTSYVAVAVALSAPYVAGVALTVIRVESAGTGWSEGFLATAALGAVGPVLVAPAVAVLGLPRVGLDWDPTGYRVSTWGILLAGGLWYALVAAVPLVALAVGMALPGGY